MNAMKKSLALMLALAMILALCACGSTQNPGTTGATEPNTTTQGTPEPTNKPTQPVDDGKITYTVTITDAEGKPLAGAVIQLCIDTNCYPCVASGEGVATIDLEENDYKVSFIAVPSGYVAEEAYYFADGETSLTIALEAA